MSKEALKLALEALEISPMSRKNKDAIDTLREALAEPQEKYRYGTPLLDAMTGKAQQALDKMAENARELGLDYEPVWGSGSTNKDYEDAMRQKRLHQLTSPTAQRTWVGLTDEEIYSVLENLQVMHHRPPTTDSRIVFARAIEAKLRSKNEEPN